MARKLAPVRFDAFSIPDAWFQLLRAAFEHGDEFVITSGSYEGQRRLQMDHVDVYIEKPGHDMWNFVSEASGIVPPTTQKYVEEQYLPYLMTGAKSEKEDYTYGQRIVGCENVPVNQLETVVAKYKKGGHKTNQCCMEVGRPTDITLGDPPCLRLVDTKIIDEALNFFVYFRSWDLWGGLPSNLCGLEYVKRHLADEVGVENGGMVIQSAGLHIYDHNYEYAAIRIGKDITDLVNSNPRTLPKTREQFGKKQEPE